MKQKLSSWLKNIGVLISIFIFLTGSTSTNQVRSITNSSKIEDLILDYSNLRSSIATKADMDIRFAIMSLKQENTLILVRALAEGQNMDTILTKIDENILRIERLENIVIQHTLSFRSDKQIQGGYTELYDLIFSKEK